MRHRPHDPLLFSDTLLGAEEFPTEAWAATPQGENDEPTTEMAVYRRPWRAMVSMSAAGSMGFAA
jgi:hypothetical protein